MNYFKAMVNRKDREPTIGPGGALSRDYETRVRPMIDLIDRLRHIGLDKDVGLPTIVVVGDQSAGKSSVLEAISGVQLPRGSGIVTRCPLELRLKRNDQEQWTGRIRYQRDPWTAGNEVDEPVEGPDDVGNKVRAAQNALAGEGRKVSTDLISLEIEGPGLPDLTLIDLPGIVRVDMQDQLDMPRKIKALIKGYIEKPETIILAVIPANVDIETSEALQMAQRVDPEHERTFGVITKTDMVDKGAEDNLLSVLLNERYPLKKGYIAVKCRGQQAILDNQTLKDALKEEEQFFEQSEHFSGIKSGLYGIRSLSSRLTDELVEQVQRVLPALKDQVYVKRDQTRQALVDMGDDVPAGNVEKNRFLFKMLTANIDDLQRLADGREINLVMTEELHFHDKCRTTYTEFARSISRNVQHKVTSSDAYRKKVKETLRIDRGRELPRFIKYDTFKKLAGGIVKEFESPANDCLRDVSRIVHKKLEHIVHARFKRFPDLQAKIKTIIAAVVQDMKDRATLALNEIIAVEQLMFSQDETYNTRLDDLLEKLAENAPDNKPGPSFGFLDAGQSQAKEVETMFMLLQAYMTIVVSRISDYVPLTIMQHMLIRVVEDLKERIYDLTKPGSGGLEALKEERSIQVRRDVLEARLDRLLKAANELHDFKHVVF